MTHGKMEDKMSTICIRLPNRVIDYFEEKSEETTIGKTTLMRSYILDAIREKEDSLSEIRNREGDNHEQRNPNR